MRDNIPVFVVVESDLLLDKKLTSTEKLLYGIICALSTNKEGACYAHSNYHNILLFSILKGHRTKFGADGVDIYNFFTLNDLIYKISITNDILAYIFVNYNKNDKKTLKVIIL